MVVVLIERAILIAARCAENSPNEVTLQFGQVSRVVFDIKVLVEGKIWAVDPKKRFESGTLALHKCFKIHINVWIAYMVADKRSSLLPSGPLATYVFTWYSSHDERYLNKGTVSRFRYQAN